MCHMAWLFKAARVEKNTRGTLTRASDNAGHSERLKHGTEAFSVRVFQQK